MDKAFTDIEEELDAKLATFGWNQSVAGTKSVREMLQQQKNRHPGVPMTEIREPSRTRDQRI